MRVRIFAIGALFVVSSYPMALGLMLFSQTRAQWMFIASFAFSLGVLWDYPPQRVVEGQVSAFPMAEINLRIGLPLGFSAVSRIQTAFVTNEVLLGASWTHVFDDIPGSPSIAIRRHTFTRPVWHTPAPKLWPPSISYGEARTVALDVLPGARFERLPYLRYGLTWTRPDDDNP